MEVDFKVKQNENSIIMVAGVGGGGCSAVKHLYSMDERQVAFMIINTDNQALQMNPIPMKIQLGDGLGAGNNPQRAQTLAEQSEAEIREALKVNNTQMLFITAGMGGGTGTGASPVVARIAREEDILTVGIVSIPYSGEGPKRAKNAVEGIEELLKHVDSLIVIDNEHIEQIYGDLSIEDAHAKADDILAMAAKNIADIINRHMAVNVDFADIKSVMRNTNEELSTGKIVLMGSAEGVYVEKGTAVEVAKEAVNSPLLHHNDIRGAQNILYNIKYGEKSVSYSDSRMVMDFLQERAGLNKQADLIWGAGRDENMGDKIRVTVIATGYDISHIPAIRDHYSEVITPGSSRDVSRDQVHREIVSIDGSSSMSQDHRVESSYSSDSFEVVSHSSGEGGYQVGGSVEPTRIEVGGGVGGDVGDDIDQDNGMRVLSGEFSSIMDDDSDGSFDQPAYLRRGVSLPGEQRVSGATVEMLESGSSGSESVTVSLFD